LSNFIILPREL
jgi:hypothetical protein